jgi:hypothetical protein
MRERAGKDPSATPWLEEAARFEEARGELVVAQTHLAAAVAIAPADAALAQRYRTVSAEIARGAGAGRPRVLPAPAVSRGGDVQITLMPDAAPDHRLTVNVVRDPDPELRGRQTEPAPPSSRRDPAADEARIDTLTRTLEGDPTNDAIVEELASLLGRYGRSMELLALLSARLEEAAPERRAELLPRHQAVLAKLEQDARVAGRDSEAELFRLARET